MDDVLKIKKNAIQYPYTFSICTIVNNTAEYALMKNSFEEKGFVDDCEYIVADNSLSNQFDAYKAISYFLKLAKGAFIIIVHQDVRLIDDIEKLKNCLAHLENKDNKWAICGNAGALGYKQMFYYIDNDSEIRKTDYLPKQVFSLDENLLILNSNRQIAISADLSSFHFYGTDLCLVADFLGYTSYVIPFMVKHLSKGNLTDLASKQHFFVKQYARKFRARFIQTTCTKFYLSNSEAKNWFYNSKLVFFFLKPYQRLFKK
jgi:hypothetical protein